MIDEMEADEMKSRAENCRRAMKAAMEAIQDYCELMPEEEEGTAFGEAPDRIEILDDLLMISEPIRRIAEDQELTVEERITAIKKSWEGRGTAKRLCPPTTAAFSKREPGETEEECIDRIVTLLAEKLVSETESGTRD